MKETICNSNLTKVDILNSRNGVALKDATTPIDVKGLGVVKVEEEGEEREVGIITSQDGRCYTTISANAIEMITDCCEIIDSGEKLRFNVEVRQSKGGRDFIALTAEIV